MFLKKAKLLLIGLLSFGAAHSQSDFTYNLAIEPVTFEQLPGLHSFVHAQYDGKWLFIGGRLDGLHARQPFNAFPESQNNTVLRVLDPQTGELWTAGLDALPITIAEQLQSTNMNFHQIGGVLYIVGGYAFSASADDHITFPYLTAVQVPLLIEAIMNNGDIGPAFYQIEDDFFAVTGGHLQWLDGRFYLVGGHRFDGRYNPMNHPTFVQEYTNAVRIFTATLEGGVLSANQVDEWMDTVHLRRRDYNLLPQVFPDGSLGFTLFSGVFQINADLPFLYPVDITADAYVPRTEFNQYLAHYHGATLGIYEEESQRMHSLFFGGMSQYYYDGENLVQDDLVPFVNTISRVVREADGSLTEYREPISFPEFFGAGAEFLANPDLPRIAGSEVIDLDAIEEETFLLGHAVGGISSTTRNPFSVNQTSSTSANTSVYEVWMTRTVTGVAQAVRADFDIPAVKVYPNPAQEVITLEFTLESPTEVHVLLSGLNGRLMMNATLGMLPAGAHAFELTLEDSSSKETLFLTTVFDHRHYQTSKILRP